MTENMTEAPCAMCGGGRSEHENSRHAYTTTPGDLVTKEQMVKRQQGSSGQQPVKFTIPAGFNPSSVSSGTGLSSLDRLVELLVDKDLISAEEALHVLLGRPRP